MVRGGMFLEAVHGVGQAIERQLAHMEKDEVRAAYHRAEYLAERRKMMQAWADYLDTLRQSDNVVSFREAG